MGQCIGIPLGAFRAGLRGEVREPASSPIQHTRRRERVDREGGR